MRRFPVLLFALASACAGADDPSYDAAKVAEAYCTRIVECSADPPSMNRCVTDVEPDVTSDKMASCLECLAGQTCEAIRAWEGGTGGDQCDLCRACC